MWCEERGAGAAVQPDGVRACFERLVRHGWELGRARQDGDAGRLRQAEARYAATLAEYEQAVREWLGGAVRVLPPAPEGEERREGPVGM